MSSIREPVENVDLNPEIGHDHGPQGRVVRSIQQQQVVDAVPKAQEKHLLHLLVEKVLIEDRCTFKVWYRLPQVPWRCSYTVTFGSPYVPVCETITSYSSFAHGAGNLLCINEFKRC